MGQQDILNLLKKHPEGLAVSEMNKHLSSNTMAINTACLKLYKGKFIKRIEKILEIKGGHGAKAKRKIFIYKLK